MFVKQVLSLGMVFSILDDSENSSNQTLIEKRTSLNAALSSNEQLQQNATEVLVYMKGKGCRSSITVIILRLPCLLGRLLLLLPPFPLCLLLGGLPLVLLSLLLLFALGILAG